MKKFLSVLMISTMLATSAMAAGGVSSGGGARGGFSSGGFGGSRGGFSSGSSSFGSSSTTPRGGFSSSSPSTTPRPSAPSSTYSTTPRSTSTTTTTTTRSYSYGGRYVSPYYGYSYGPWGYGYHYSNGLMTGIILGSMMHPMGTVMYTGPGYYYNNALLYPDGRVVNQNGYLVGNYVNNQFVPVDNGPLVAQSVPSDAQQQQQQPAQNYSPVQQPQPVIVRQVDYTSYYIGGFFFALILGICIIFVIIL